MTRHQWFCLRTCLLVVCISMSYVSAHPSNKTEDPEPKNVVQKWKIMETQMKAGVEHIFGSITPFLLKNSGGSNVSSQCMKQTLKLMVGLRNLEPWALKFLDSSSKMVDGILESSMAFFGSYDECLGIEVPSNKKEGKPLFHGQYCSISVSPPLPSQEEEWEMLTLYIANKTKGNDLRKTLLQIPNLLKNKELRNLFLPHIRICVPSGCTVKDLNNIIRKIGDTSGMTITVRRCEKKEKLQFSSEQIFSICFFSFLGFLVFLATAVEFYIKRKDIKCESKFNNALLTFSLLTNIRDFLDTAKVPKDLKCFNGLRFITMIWIIYGHSSLYMDFRALASLTRYQKESKYLSNQVLSNGLFGVETFFFLGGFLVSYNIVKNAKDGTLKFNYLQYIIIRLFRFLPSVSSLLIFLLLAPVLTSGPLWNEDSFHYEQNISKKCLRQWWKFLLFINNYGEFQDKCLPYLWYVAADFQLYILAPIIILPLVRWPKLGILLSVVWFLVTPVSAAFAGYYYRMPPNAVAWDIGYERINGFTKHFFSPLPHAASYCIGIFAGYIYAKKPEVKIPVKIQVIGWILAVVCNVSLIYGPVEWARGVTPPISVIVLYYTLQRPLWTIGVLWCVICCITGHGGLVNTFLSWNVFIPLARLTFLAYLVHPIVQSIYMESSRTPYMPSTLNNSWLFFASFVVSYLAAFGGTLLIERPFMKLCKIMFTPGTKKADDMDKNGVSNLNMPPVANGEFLTMKKI